MNATEYLSEKKYLMPALNPNAEIMKTIPIEAYQKFVLPALKLAFDDGNENGRTDTCRQYEPTITEQRKLIDQARASALDTITEQQLLAYPLVQEIIARTREDADKKAYDKWTGQCHICHEPVDIPVCRNCYKDAKARRK
jgi:hypothetical protein